MGSNVAWWGRFAGRLLWPVQLRRDLITVLVPNSEMFLDIATAFKPLAEDMPIFSYYEQIKTDRLGIIVSEQSAIIGSNCERARPLQRDHKSMCRFVGKDDNNYKNILEDLRTCVEDLSKGDHVARKASGGRPMESVTDCMDLMRQNCGATGSVSGAQPVSGTCQWLFE